MQESGFEIPAYVRTKQASGELADGRDNPNGICIDSQADVWLSSLKLACGDFRPIIQEIHAKKIADAAKRYAITDDLKSAAAFMDRMDIDPQQISTEGDWHRTKDWLYKNAEYMDLNIREGIVDHLFEKAAELEYIPALSEKCLLFQIAERDPYAMPEMRKVAEGYVHKLATGTYYTTDQFAKLPIEQVKEYLPNLVKQSSFEAPILQPDLFAKAAASADWNSAKVLDALLHNCGQSPVGREADPPIEINDAMLAAL